MFHKRESCEIHASERAACLLTRASGRQTAKLFYHMNYSTHQDAPTRGTPCGRRLKQAIHRSPRRQIRRQCQTRTQCQIRTQCQTRPQCRIGRSARSGRRDHLEEAPLAAARGVELDGLRRGGEAGGAAEGAERERQARGVLGLDQHALVVLAEGAALALAKVALHDVVGLRALHQ